jgi:hypothetical protein
MTPRPTPAAAATAIDRADAARRMSGDGFRIRTMTLQEVALAADWAAAEGGNPGWADAQCFAAIDPEGFLVGECEGEPASTIAVVNYDDRFAFLGFCRVRPDLRGRGFGMQTWQAGIAHAGARTVGLSAAALQDKIAKAGFAVAHGITRYRGVAVALRAPSGTRPLSQVPLDLIDQDDATVFPAARGRLLRAWVAAEGHAGQALIRGGRLAGWGVIRPCRRGRTIGPLMADDRATAEAVFAALVGAGHGEVYVDVPQPNREAAALAAAHGLSPVSETARMYSGPVRPMALHRLFGVMSPELG